MATKKRTKSKPAKQSSGGRRLLESGKRPILLGVQVGDHEFLQRAAGIERRPVTQFVLHHALQAAHKLLGE